MKQPDRIIDQNFTNPVSLFDRIHIFIGKKHFVISRKRAINIGLIVNYGKLKR